MVLKKSLLYLPRPSSKYPGCFPLHFEKKIGEILETNNFVHFFSGLSRMGFTIDINKEVNPDLVENVESLSIESNSFDGGFADPPYNEKFAEELYQCKYPRWSLWTKELVRVVRPNGRIGIMQNYIVPQLIGCKMEEIIVILTRIKQFPKIVTIQRKILEL